MSRVRSAVLEAWPRLAAVVGLLVLWQLAHSSGFFDQLTLPSPLDAFQALGGAVSEGRLGTALGRSLIRLAVGFGAAIAVGSATGLLMVASAFAHRSVGSLVSGLQSLPSISWLPLAILWFGLNERAVVFVVFMGAFPAVALATSNGLRQVPPLMERAGRTLGARGWSLYRRVVFPAAIPAYVGGLQQGWAFAWRSLMAGELIATGGLGLGQMLEQARQRLDTAEVFGVMIVIVLVGMTVDLLIFGTLDRRIRRRRGLSVGAFDGGARARRGFPWRRTEAPALSA